MSEERLDEPRSSTVGGAPVGYTGLSPLLYDPSHPLRILVADDTESSQLVIGKLLERLGHTVRLASNGEEAVRLFESEPFDLVMMDIEMPVMNGFRAAEVIRSLNESGKVVPIVAVSAFGQLNDQSQVYAHGMNDFLEKPLRVDDVKRIISENRRLDLLVTEKEHRFEALLAAVPVGVFEADRAGKIHFTNARWTEITGLAQARALGDGWLEGVHPDDRERAAADWRRSVSAGTPFNLEFRFLRADASVVWVLGQSVPFLTANGEVAGQIGAITDISRSKLIEAEHASLEAQVREAQKMTAIGTLAGGIAHDFNNIIATILGNAELVRQDVEGNTAALVSVEEIRKAGVRGRDLVRQILSFSRREAIERVVVDLAPVVQETARLLRSTLPAKVSLSVQCAPDAPCVLANEGQIKQILINIATNAMQAMRGRDGLIEIGLGQVTVSAELSNLAGKSGLKQGQQALCMTISDNGPGMDAAVLARIFDPFFTTKPVGEGTGLGMSVVHGIILSHDGAITVQSLPGLGATFTIYLPAVAPVVVDGGAVLKPAAGLPAVEGGGGLRVLYLDDDEALVLLMRRYLERLGYVMTTFTVQDEALQALRADPLGFDLVLTDFNMPGLSGIDVAREVRSLRADLPVVMISGFIDEDLKAQALDVGVRELIRKEDSVEKLCDLVSLCAVAMRTS